jgi:glycerate kinase
MKIVVAPDAYKGCLNALSAARAIERGIRNVERDIAVKLIPMADGGEGTVEAMITALGGEIIPARVKGPLGETTDAFFGLLEDRTTAVIELAAAAGLNLIPANLRNPLLTTSYGVGELIRHALETGAKKLILGIGGSGTNDGGAGMATALGVRLLDRHGQEIRFGGGHLTEITDIDFSGFDPRLSDMEIMAACDVTNPLCGPQGASAVYGPQKGATPETVALLDKNLQHYAEIIQKSTGLQVRDIPGAGAAGGVGAALIAFLKANLQPGAQLIMRAADMDKVLNDADLVITGEGLTDHQTLFGKVPLAVAEKAVKHQVPVVCLSGGLTEDAQLLYKHGFSGVFSITEGPVSLADAIQNAEVLLERAAERILRLYLAGRSFRHEGLCPKDH